MPAQPLDAAASIPRATTSPSEQSPTAIADNLPSVSQPPPPPPPETVLSGTDLHEWTYRSRLLPESLNKHWDSVKKSKKPGDPQRLRLPRQCMTAPVRFDNESRSWANAETGAKENQEQQAEPTAKAEAWRSRKQAESSEAQQKKQRSREAGIE